MSYRCHHCKEEIAEISIEIEARQTIYGHGQRDFEVDLDEYTEDGALPVWMNEASEWAREGDYLYDIEFDSDESEEDVESAWWSCPMCGERSQVLFWNESGNRYHGGLIEQGDDTDQLLRELEQLKAKLAERQGG